MYVMKKYILALDEGTTSARAVLSKTIMSNLQFKIAKMQGKNPAFNICKNV